MHGVSRITIAENIMLISYHAVSPAFMAEALEKLAREGVVLDMISQTAAQGGSISFSFTSAAANLEAVVRTVGSTEASPMISSGYSKLNLFGEDMVESIGVAAKALQALTGQGIEIAMLTTSDLDISLLVRQEDEDVSLAVLTQAYELN